MPNLIDIINGYLVASGSSAAPRLDIALWGSPEEQRAQAEKIALALESGGVYWSFSLYDDMGQLIGSLAVSRPAPVVVFKP